MRASAESPAQFYFLRSPRTGNVHNRNGRPALESDRKRYIVSDLSQVVSINLEHFAITSQLIPPNV